MKKKYYKVEFGFDRSWGSSEHITLSSENTSLYVEALYKGCKPSNENRFYVHIYGKEDKPVRLNYSSGIKPLRNLPTPIDD